MGREYLESILKSWTDSEGVFATGSSASVSAPQLGQRPGDAVRGAERGHADSKDNKLA